MLSEPTLFRLWLTFVLLARSLGIFLGYTNVAVLKFRTYPRIKNAKEISPVFGRMWSNWTLMSLSCLLMLILYPTNMQIYFLNIWAFLIAWTYFSMEYWYFKTAGGQVVSLIFVFAGFTSLWMIYRLITGQAYVM